MASGELAPASAPERIVTGFPYFQTPEHRWKAIAFDEMGGLYVHVGPPSNACQEENRIESSPGRRPCPDMDRTGGIWRYHDRKVNQQHPRDGIRVATGVRHTLGMAWNSISASLFFVCRFSKRRDPFLTIFSKPFPPLE
jgi:glucose/arabinose dehydrogenase